MGENATIHLSPYQDAPFDLHVGFELRKTSIVDSNDTIPSRGFYFRRQGRIKKFLETLSNLTDQELCDLVHDSISSRLQYMHSNNQKDPFLDRDVMQLRTLSLIAAGCGGRQLAAIFRCLFFDYRHYSGGLPDLLLVRAIHIDSVGSPNPLVDLGDWVGETFSVKYQEALGVDQAAILLGDKDDEFLGCSKFGDSGAKASRSNRGGQRSSGVPGAPRKTYIPSMDDILAKRLLLDHRSRRVRVECMMVEVKSSNDRLDSRQEDWLNVLDRYGEARVCKFDKSCKTDKAKF
jgi:hypothetical protein